MRLLSYNNAHWFVDGYYHFMKVIITGEINCGGQFRHAAVPGGKFA